jgi:hypothetical protein
MPKQRNKASQLFRIADSQQGYFTTQQLREAGFDATNVTYHVKVGNWIRAYRGIYRLSNYPASDQSDLVLWSLWSRNRQELPQGVYSHETALRIYELSDLMPARLHMTVPPSFRRSGEIPNALLLHYARITPQELEIMHGFGVTRPLRAIQDLVANESVPRDVLRQALEDALRQGLVTPPELQNQQSDGVQQLLKSMG